MNLDELVQSIPDDEAELRSQLAHWVDEWKNNEVSIEGLVKMITKWHGNVWFKDTHASNNFWQSLCQFKVEAIDGIDGMTGNERLYIFGLFPLWDSSDEAGKIKIRKKIHAEL